MGKATFCAVREFDYIFPLLHDFFCRFIYSDGDDIVHLLFDVSCKRSLFMEKLIQWIRSRECTSSTISIRSIEGCVVRSVIDSISLKAAGIIPQPIQIDLATSHRKFVFFLVRFQRNRFTQTEIFPRRSSLFSFPKASEKKRFSRASQLRFWGTCRQLEGVRAN